MLRFSVVFFGSMLVVSVVAGLLLWFGASTVGVVDNVEQSVRELFGLQSFKFNGMLLMRTTIVGGVVMVLLATGATLLVAVIYNLTADVVGGIEVTVEDEETAGEPVS